MTSSTYERPKKNINIIHCFPSIKKPATQPKRKKERKNITLLLLKERIQQKLLFYSLAFLFLRGYSLRHFLLYFKIFICDVHLLDSISTPTLKITLWEKLPGILLDLCDITILSLYLLYFVWNQNHNRHHVVLYNLG